MSAFQAKQPWQWVVFDPVSRVGESYVGGSLTGEYTGIGAEISAGLGIGANALIGGGFEGFVLQPISVQVSTGVSIAAEAQTLSLKYTGPAS